MNLYVREMHAIPVIISSFFFEFAKFESHFSLFLDGSRGEEVVRRNGFFCGGAGRAGRIRKQVYLKRCLPWKFTLSSILFLAGEKVMHVRFITAYLIKFL